MTPLFLICAKRLLAAPNPNLDTYTLERLGDLGALEPLDRYLSGYL